MCGVKRIMRVRSLVRVCGVRGVMMTDEGTLSCEGVWGERGDDD